MDNIYRGDGGGWRIVRGVDGGGWIICCGVDGGGWMTYTELMVVD